jgi:hypothetical protein
MLKLGDEGLKLVDITDFSRSRMFSKCVDKWKSYKKANKKTVIQMSILERMEWAKGVVGFTLGGMIDTATQYLHFQGNMPKGFELEVEDDDDTIDHEDNKFDFTMDVNDTETKLHAKTYQGDLAATAGTWSPNNYAVSPIRSFVMSFEYGKKCHPGDTTATSEEEATAVVAGLPALTSLNEYWVFIFCVKEDTDMVHRVLSESKGIQGEPEDLVSHYRSVFVRVLDVFK